MQENTQPTNGIRSFWTSR